MRRVRMKSSLAARMLFAICLLIFAASCGGVNGSAVQLGNGGIGGTGIISYGSITAIGSITVNGVRFDTRDAAVIVAGEEQGVGDQAVLSYLDVGNVVRVEGRRSGDSTRATATRVVFSDSVRGPVERISDIDTHSKKVLVLGQTVIVDDSTVFRKVTIATMALNDVLQVCGLVDDRGAIRATYIERVADDFTSGALVRVKGIVQSLDVTAKTFEINGLTLDYSLAPTSDLPAGVPADGMPVRVMGTLGSAGGSLAVTKIELEDELGGVKDAEEAVIEGFVTAIVKHSPLKVRVGNQLVQTDDDTELEGGVEEDIEVGDWLEVEGPLVDGTLFAEEISFKD
jgi:hypothetical protein